MKQLMLVCCVLMTVISTLRAAEPSVDAALEQLQRAITQADSSKSRTNPSESMYLLQYMQTIRQSIARGSLEGVEQSIVQLRALIPDEKVQKASEELLTIVQKQMAAQQLAYTEEVDQSIEKAVTACFAAKEPKDLDSLIIELSQLSQRRGDSSLDPQGRNAEKARSMVNFLCRWQDYLMHTKSGNAAEAQAVLKSLSQDNGSYPFVPRSEILSRMSATSTGKTAAMRESEVAPPSVAGKSLKDIDSLRREVSELIFIHPNVGSLRQFSQNLDQLNRAYYQAQQGFVGEAYNYCTSNYGTGSTDELLSLRQELLMMVLPAYLDTEKSYPPAAGEKPQEYALRVVKEARAKGDWNTVWRCLEAQQNVGYSGRTPAWLRADIQGISFFIVAQNQEKAGQYTEAVRSYKRVLTQPGENLPIQETTARLQALEKAHPEEYKAGTATSTDTQLPPSRNYPPGYPR